MCYVEGGVTLEKLNMCKNNYDGILVTFCGLDGCGKSTMIRKLISEIGNQMDVFLTRQPTDYVRKSEIFRTYMDNPDHSAYDYRSLSLLAASDRIQHTSKIILPKLKQGKFVISDRYYYSCLANLHARGFEGDKWIYEVSQSIVQPDIAFFLDIPVETAISRVRSRPEEKNRYIDVELQYKLRDKYIEICKKNNGVLVSTQDSLENTYSVIIKKVNELLEEKNGIRRKGV